MSAWPCGHPRTPENTQSVGESGQRCRECRRAIARRSAGKRAGEVDMYYQVRALPGQLERARRRLAHLEATARRLGLNDLVA